MTKVILNDKGEVPNNNSPWWMEAIKQYGLFTCSAVALVWFLLTQQGQVLAKIDAETTKVNSDIQQHMVDSAARSEKLFQSNARMEAYARIMCSFQAKTQNDRNTCNSVR